MGSLRKKVIALSVIAIAILGFLIWFFYYASYNFPSYSEEVNYTIPGVPYNGISTLFFKNADSTTLSSISDITRYWGDKRFRLSDFKKAFPSIRERAEYDSAIPAATLSSLKSFFENNGYETYFETSSAGKEIQTIKKFINQKKKIPVIVFQKRSADPSIAASGYRVVIGIYENQNKVIVHDHDFGNNYEISFEDFNKMCVKDACSILAIWPSDDLKSKISGPDFSSPYPKRIENADKLGNLLVWGAKIEEYYWKKDYVNQNLLLDKFIKDESFTYFPAACRMEFLSSFANSFIDINQSEKAIEMINNEILPLYNDPKINEMPEGWEPPKGRLSYPFFVLSRAYLKSGQKDLAISTYREVIKIRQDNEKNAGIPVDSLVKIPELEKAIAQ